jgi:PST family polysaccharide transporter
MAEMTAVRSAYFWAGAGNIVKAALTFGLSILLARLLDPSHYGLIGVVMAFVNILMVIQDAGLGQAVVYFDETEDTLPTYHTVTVLSGVVLTALTALIGPALAWFYNMPELTVLAPVMGLSLILGGLRSVPQGLLMKELRFKELALIETVAGVAAGVVAVLLALAGAGVWSLVANILLGAGVQTWWTCRLRPAGYTRRWKPEVVRRALDFGLPLTGSRVLWQAYLNSDAMIIGKMLGEAPLGYYSYALRLARFLSERVFGIVNRVSFPSFASMKEDRPRLLYHWLLLTEVLALIQFPAMLALAMNAEDFVLVVLGDKWLPAALPLRLLCAAEAIRSVQVIMPPLLSAVGRTDLVLRYNVVNAIALPAAFAAGCHFGGLAGVGAAWVTIYPVLAIHLLKYTVSVCGGSYWGYLRSLRAPLLVTASCLAAMLPFDWLLAAGWERLTVRCAAGGACYLFCLGGLPGVRRRVLEIARGGRRAPNAPSVVGAKVEDA